MGTNNTKTYTGSHAGAYLGDAKRATKQRRKLLLAHARVAAKQALLRGEQGPVWAHHHV